MLRILGFFFPHFLVFGAATIALQFAASGLETELAQREVGLPSPGEVDSTPGKDVGLPSQGEISSTLVGQGDWLYLILCVLLRLEDLLIP